MSVGMNLKVAGNSYPYSAAVTGEDGQKDPSGIDRKGGVTEVKTDAVNAGQKDDFGSQSVDSSGDSPQKPGVNDFPGDNFSGILAKLDGFNMIEVLYALNQAAQEIRKAGREMRHAERDIAQNEAMRAADKIRSAAFANMLFGVISGGVNIGMGVFSTISATKQLTSVKSAAADLKMAKQETAQVKADAKLAESQVKLTQAKAEAAAKHDNVTEAKANVKKLEQELDAMGKDADSPEVKAKQTDLKAARENLAKAETEALAADKNVNALEAEVKGAAAEAEKANADRTSTLEKAVEQKKSAINDLTEERNGAQKEVETAGKKVKDLTGDKTSSADAKTRAQADLDKATEKFADVDGRLKTAENSLAGLEGRLSESRSQAAIYKDPTSEASLRGAQERSDASSSRLAAATERQTVAEAGFNRAVTIGQVEAQRIQGWNTIAGGANQIMQGGGQVIASESEAEKAELTAESQKAASMEQESAEFQKAAEELMTSVRSILKEALQAYNQANAAIYRNM